MLKYRHWCSFTNDGRDALLVNCAENDHTIANALIEPTYSYYPNPQENDLMAWHHYLQY